jgi:hypothetical protein
MATLTDKYSQQVVQFAKYTAYQSAKYGVL